MSSEPGYLLLLLVVGLVAGVMNTLAGGGSNLSLPVLMMMGLPADLANGTNRLGIALQCVAGSLGFKRSGQLDTGDFKAIAFYTMVGGLCGALVAALMPNLYLKPLLLAVMILMSLVMLFRPGLLSAEVAETAWRVDQRRGAVPALLLAGFYGGFVQAGVGFILLAVFGGLLRYNLVKANALKLLTTLGFTLVALAVFILMNQVVWSLGLVLGVGYVVGSLMAVRMAINVSQKTLRWSLFVITLLACVAALLTESKAPVS